jgi:NAD(P)-dependent dehydrogenase (short-subunit alcohol dehydrogenase family)
MSKHIAIIGGTSGIGRATVAQLQADGHIIHAACRSPEKLADLGFRFHLTSTLFTGQRRSR